jgi:hypothetical protein
MCGTAAHLVTNVLPDVPVRQWVLTAPHEVRRLLALRPDALSACNRIFVSEIARHQKKASGLDDALTGSVTFVQRFNATLGSFVHYHVIAIDGVFSRPSPPRTEGDGAIVFHRGPTPSPAEIAEVAARVAARMIRWLRRRKLIGSTDEHAEEGSNETPELSPIEACMQLSLSFSAGATFVRLDGVATANDPYTFGDDHRRDKKSPWSAEVDGFNVHAGVTVGAGDRDALERLCRYGARPPFSLERISRLADGRVAYLLKKPRKNGATHLVLTPVHFLARISALIPPPRFPLLRFAGVLAPSAALRPTIVAMREQNDNAHTDATPHTATDARSSHGTNKKNKKRKATTTAAEAATPMNANDTPASTTPYATSLGAGVVPPCYARIDWASLLRRVYLVDVLTCDACGGRRHIIADVTDRDVIVAILQHLGLDADAPPLARARDPTFDAA